MRRLAASGAVLLALVGCAGREGSGNDALVGEGRDLYLANCAQCHGFDLKGTNTGPSFLSVVYEPNHHSDEAFWLAVTRGVLPHHWNFGPMPPIPGLTREDVEAIAAFVRDQQGEHGFEPYPP